MALALIFYVLINGTYTGRTLAYLPDFGRSISRDITGWYPEARGNFSDNKFNVISEPLYIKLYVPVEFEKLMVEGSVDYLNESLRLGLRQQDGSWYWQEIQNQDFSLIYNLENAEIKRNQIEMILSMPNLTATSSVSFYNNWQFIFER